MSTSFHTIIIGGGPGGLACAALLAGRGKEVLLLERHTSIGGKVCAGGIPGAGVKLPDTLWERSFACQHIKSPWQRVTIHGSQPIIRTVDRVNLGCWLAEKATSAGAVIITGAQVSRISGHRVRTATGEEYEAEFLVGADGSNSMVRRCLGLPVERFGLGLNCQVPGDFPEMEWHLDHGLFAGGYAWIFPHCRSASIGVYHGNGADGSARLLHGLHHWAAKRGVNLGRGAVKMARVNHDFRGWRFGKRFLVGDAAGLASGLTGEGITPAIISGEEAAKAILTPGYESERMKELLKKHRRHTRLLALTGNRKATGRLIMEALILGLRAGLIPINALEMGPPATI